MPSAKKFNAMGFKPYENEYEIRYPGEQQYANISSDNLIPILEDILAGDREFAGNIRYRKWDSVDRFDVLNKKDYGAFLDALKGNIEIPTDDEVIDGIEPAPEENEETVEEKGELMFEEACDEVPVPESVEEERYDEDDGTMLRFCCHPMMKAMLGGEGHVLISMETGKIQLGATDMKYCPFCGKPICTVSPPIEVIPPEE